MLTDTAGYGRFAGRTSIMHYFGETNPNVRIRWTLRRTGSGRLSIVNPSDCASQPELPRLDALEKLLVHRYEGILARVVEEDCVLDGVGIVALPHEVVFLRFE
jgi:hypothetical protein